MATRFGRYTVVRQLGSGGMGSVYEAIHADLQKRVAIKTLHASFAEDEMLRARFLREGQLSAKLRHPHVVDVFDVGVEADVPYLVMEILDGEDLDHVLKREPIQPVAKTMERLLPVCAAVAAAHEAGIIHRDLKPANVFLARTAAGEVPKVLDFGLGKLADAEGGGLTGTSVALGTPDYMAPEQVQNSREADGRCDQYSLGVLLYQCLVGKKPFAGETMAENVFRVLSGQYDPPRQVNPNIPPALELVIVKAMSLAPEDRYASVSAFARALLPFATQDVRHRWESVFGPPESSMTPPPLGGPGRISSLPPVQESPYTLGDVQPGPPSVLFMGRSGPTQILGPEKPPFPWLFVVIPLVLSVLGVGGVVGWKLTHPPAPPPAPPRVETFTVQVAVTPATATLELDGAPVGTGTYTAALPRDGRMHLLRATAPGYVEGVLAFRDAAPAQTLTLTAVVVDAGPPPRRRRREH
ncbi:MAG: serine/threonine protein kinase [Deltaproteobacteria bacterium]|nr:serine/threonine protein kinase [Deltaproteobacteria bacterium]